MRTPNLFLPGVMKSGTTSLYQYVRQHEQVLLSDPKEPNFYVKQYDRGYRYLWKNYLSHYDGEPWIGTASPWNLFHPPVAERISDDVPEPRFVVIFRNPADRAYSHWWQRFASGRTREPFAESIRQPMERIRGGRTMRTASVEVNRGGFQYFWKENGNAIVRPENFILDMSCYSVLLQNYYRYFSRDQFLFLTFEQFVQNPAEETEKVWSFLGLDCEKKVEEVSRRRGGQSRYAGWLFQGIKKMTRTFGVTDYVSQTGRDRVWNLLERMNPVSASRPGMNQETRSRLQEFFEPFNRKLEELTGLDTVSWSDASRVQ